MTNEEIAAQVTALWKRVGTAEMASPHPLGYALDEEVFLLCQHLVSQAYDEAIKAQCPYCAEGYALDTNVWDIPTHQVEQVKGEEKRDTVACYAGQIHALKDSLCPHTWTDARNEAVTNGEICLKCGAVRAGNASSVNEPVSSS